MLNQLERSVDLIANATAVKADPIEKLIPDVPRQVCMMVHRIRFTQAVQGCIRENRQMSIVQRQNNAIKVKLGELLMDKELPEGERSTMNALQIVLHEQAFVLTELMKKKTTEELNSAWNEHMRFYH